MCERGFCGGEIGVARERRGVEGARAEERRRGKVETPVKRENNVLTANDGRIDFEIIVSVTCNAYNGVS